eukprot:1020823-Pelagomonas_calceolata.AAC.1
MVCTAAAAVGTVRFSHGCAAAAAAGGGGGGWAASPAQPRPLLVLWFELLLLLRAGCVYGTAVHCCCQVSQFAPGMCQDRTKDERCRATGQ